MNQREGFEPIRRRRDIRSTSNEYGCGTKRQFKSYRAAKNQLKHGWERTMGRVAPYHCGGCGYWHIGNSNGFRAIA